MTSGWIHNMSVFSSSERMLSLLAVKTWLDEHLGWFACSGSSGLVTFVLFI